MKKRWIDRMLLGIAGVAGAASFGFLATDFWCGSFKVSQNLLYRLGTTGGKTALIVVISALALMMVLSVLSLWRAFEGKKEPLFVLQHTEHGDLNIAVSAIDELVHKCVDTHDEILLSETQIRNTRDGLVISLRVSLGSGVSIPLAVAALQKQMKQYITASTGLDVKEVCVQVDTAEAKDIKPTAYVMSDMLGRTPVEEHAEVPGYLASAGTAHEEEKELPAHQRMFIEDDQPAIVPEPPAVTLELPQETLELPQETLELPDEIPEVPAETPEIPAETVEQPELEISAMDRSMAFDEVVMDKLSDDAREEETDEPCEAEEVQP